MKTGILRHESTFIDCTPAAEFYKHSDTVYSSRCMIQPAVAGQAPFCLYVHFTLLSLNRSLKL